MKDMLRISRRALLGGIASAAALPLLPATGFAQAKKTGGTLTMVTWPAATYLTSAINTSGAETLISGKLYEGLLEYDVGMVPTPGLAESWEVAPDGLSITFNLRQGVKWHDGEPFTSRDVQVSILEILKQHHGRGRTTFANVIDVEAPDEHTAIFRLSEPSPAMIKALNASESPILPAHLYAGTDIMANPHNVDPVGTGPFVLEQYNRGDNVILKRNPDYWQEGKPYVDQLVVRFIPDAATRAAMLEAGDAQLVASSLIPPMEILRLQELPDFEVTARGYEVSSSMHLMDFNTRNPILADVKVRQAFAHLIDTSWITENIWFGFGEPGVSPLHQDQVDFFTTEGVPTYPYDLEKAEALLDEAGYPRQSNGTRFTMFIDPSPYGEEPLRGAEYIREQCRQAGIVLNIRTSDAGGFVKRIYGDRDFDLSTFTGSAGVDPTIGVHRFYWSKNIKEGVAFSNGSGYSNPEVDALLEAATVEMDLEKRKQQYAEFQKIVMRDVPTLPLCGTNRVTIANVKVKDHTVGGIGPFGTFADVWLDQ